ncbi:penicillin-binding protein 2 [Bacillaceae bacterium]
MDYDYDSYYRHEDTPKQKMIRKRANLLFLAIFFIFCTLLIRLSYVQLAKGEEYSKLANEKAIKTLEIPAPRGEILDRNGELLVTNEVSFTVLFQEKEWMEKPDYFIRLATKLAPILRMPAEEVLEKMDTGYNLQGEWVGRQAPKYLEKIIKFGLEPKEIAVLSERREEFQGIVVQAYPFRRYIDNVAVQTIGYVRPFAVAVTSIDKYKGKEDYYLPSQQVGMDGIELSFEDELKGRNGYRQVVVDPSGTILAEKKVVYPKKGNHLYLTIDKRVQREAEEFIADYLQELRRQHSRTRHVKNAYAVAMEVQTGRIVAMVSHPDYDPNQWLQGVTTEQFKDIQFSIYNGTIRWAPYDARPLGMEEANKHPSSIVPVGSVVKPLTVLMALNEGLISPTDRWRDAVVYQYGRSSGDRVTNAYTRDLGWLTPQTAIQKSSNTYMARIGDMMARSVKNPVETFQRYHHLFGLGVKTGVDLPFESDGGEDYIANSERVSTLFAIVQASFGQQERYTALQLAQYAATIANDGKRLRPLIVDKIVDPDGKVVKTFKPEVLSEAKIPQKYFDIIKEGMELVTQPGGTSYYPMLGFPYRVAAKTGTSQQDIPIKRENGSGYYLKQVENATYISYAPADNPKLAVAVVVPEGGYGTNSAAYIARGIYEIYDKYIGLGDKPAPIQGP